MSEREHLGWFRRRLAASLEIEPKDPAPILAWQESRRSSIRFKAELIGLDDLRDWSRDKHGNLHHRSGQFFGIEGARVEASDTREVTSWDQPIYTQLDGGVLGMVARETTDRGVQFLLQAIPECGNIGVIQLGPTIQSTWSNIRRAHGGKRPPMLEVISAEAGVRIIYRANHNEEGGRFWQKSNQNVVAFLDDERVIETDMKMFYWASLSQIKELALRDNVLNPFVKTILFPL
jgi:dTDP-4-dehydro-6-deoxy-alpha-D-glucopyranose 2,3-dehydratase